MVTVCDPLFKIQNEVIFYGRVKMMIAQRITI